MNNLQAFLRKYAVVFGIFTGLGILATLTIAVILIPEEAGIFMTMAGLICSSLSMFLIARDCREIDNGRSRKSHRELV